MWKDGRHGAGVQWVCAVKRRISKKRWSTRNRERQLEMQRVAGRRLRMSRKEAGVCVNCGGALLSESLCWDCLNRLEEASGIRI